MQLATAAGWFDKSCNEEDLYDTSHTEIRQEHISSIKPCERKNDKKYYDENLQYKRDLSGDMVSSQGHEIGFTK